MAAALPRLRSRYAKEIVPALMKRFGYTNPMQVPRVRKVIVNMGLGEAVANPKLIDGAVSDLTAITGQKPIVTRAKKSIATFKLREGMAIGAKVTLRRERMWEFLDRLISLSLPRVRDFRGISSKAFDGAGNYTLGLKEQIVFPEIDFDKVDRIKGMNITVVTTAETNEEAKELLGQLGMPFRS
jgi:large subunit ribosomal protein L5